MWKKTGCNQGIPIHLIYERVKHLNALGANSDADDASETNAAIRSQGAESIALPPTQAGPVHAAQLIGIFKRPNAEQLRDEIALFAYTQIIRSLSTDAVTRNCECRISALVNALAADKPAPDRIPNLWRFAVLCYDLAHQCQTEITTALGNWITATCGDSGHSPDTIRACNPQQSTGRIPRLAVEIAWPSSPAAGRRRGDSAPEVYARWGEVRERIPLPRSLPASTDRRQMLVSILNHLDSLRRLPDVDHVEIVAEPPHTHAPWEYKPANSRLTSSAELHQLPVCVRLPGAGIGRRECPNEPIESKHIVKDSDPDFHVGVLNTGVFVGSAKNGRGGPKHQHIDAVLSGVSLGLWSRKPIQAAGVTQLHTAMLSRRVEEIPLVVHKLRKIRDNGSLWQEVVLLFDPNLPPFRFSHDHGGPARQRRVNAGLR